MRVLVLFIRYGTDKYRDAVDELDLIYRRQAPNLNRETIIIDNALPADFSQDYGPNRRLIGGNNINREFSGWQHALDTLGTDIKQFDAIHLVSSAFQMLYTDYLNYFSPRLVEIVAERPVCTGHIDYYPYPIRYGPYVSRYWIRTSFWFINTSEFLRLGNIASVREQMGLFSREGDWPFELTGPLSPGYQMLIHDWLTSEQGTGQGTSWHSRLDLNIEGNRTLFEQKATAIINEHLLSIRLRAQGTSVLDMTYLGKLAESGDAVPPHFPAWREQIRLRRIPGHDNIGNMPVR
jgi:hypothetical protein